MLNQTPINTRWLTNVKAETRLGIAADFEFYNQERLHQTLGYRTRARSLRKRCSLPSSDAEEKPLALRALQWHNKALNHGQDFVP